MRKLLSTIGILALVGAFLLAAVPVKAEDPFCGRKHDWNAKQTFKKEAIFKDLVTVEGTLSANQHSEVFYVDSGSGANVPDWGKSWKKPFDTVEYALQQCTADRGDIIYLLPGHAESISTTAIWDLDIAGVSIIGFGAGDNRPTITQTATDAYVDVAADDITLMNILFVAGVNTGTVAMVFVEADDCTIEWCEFRNVSSLLHTNHFIEVSGTDNAADRLTVKNSRFFAVSADADCDSAISLLGAQDSVLLEGNIISGTFDDASIHNPTGEICTNLQIIGNVVENTQTGDWAIELVSACTGNMAGNRCFADTAGTVVDPGSLMMSDNFEVNADDTGGDPGWLLTTGLDHLLELDGATSAYPENAVDDSILAKLLSKSDPADISDYDCQTDSLEAISDSITAGTSFGAGVHLDHLVALDGATEIYPEQAVNDSIICKILGDDNPASCATYDNTTDSLEAIGTQVGDTNLEARVVAANVTDLLDHLVKTGDGTAAYPASVASESILGYIMGIDGDPTDFDEATDSLEALGDQVADSNIEARVVAANVTDLLDHLVKTSDGTGAYPASVASESILAYIMGDDATAVASTYDNSTDSLEAIGTKTTQISSAAGPSYGHPNYLLVQPGTFDTSGTWSTAAKHELLTVTGCVKMTIIPVCTTTVVSVGHTGTIQLGDETTTDSVIAASTLGDGVMAAGELWTDATLTRTILTQTQLNANTFVVCAGKDIGYEVVTNALSGGAIDFHVYWTPMDATGAVVAGAGGTL